MQKTTYTTNGHKVDDLSAPDQKGCRTGVVIWEDSSGVRATRAVFSADGNCVSHLESDWRLQLESDNVVYLGQRPERRVMIQDVLPPYYSSSSFTATFLQFFNDCMREQVPQEIESDFYMDLLNAFYTPLVWKDYSLNKRRFIRKVVINAAVKAALGLLPVEEFQDD